MMRHIALLTVALSSSALAFATTYSPNHDLEGPVSPYTIKLKRALLKPWPPRKLPYEATRGDRKNPVGLRCLTTQENPTYIGVEQWMEIDAPVERVKAILDDFESYKKLFVGFDDVKVLKSDGNTHVLYWEQHIPVLPNISYEMNYLVSQLSDGKYVYRYQLRQARSIHFSDGVIVLESASPMKTRYSEYDFFDANWGLMSLSKERIWTESVEGIYLSDLAIKLKAENPSWDYDRIREEARKTLDRFPAKGAIEARGPVDIF